MYSPFKGDQQLCCAVEFVSYRSLGVKREEQVFVECCGFFSVSVEVVAACDQSEVVVAARGSIFRSGSDLAGVALFWLFSFGSVLASRW